MEWFQAVVLGLIQGLTEFLPVSSSGHLTIFKAIFGIEADNLSFEVLSLLSARRYGTSSAVSLSSDTTARLSIS